MDIPEYISQAEVKRVCMELGISDWTALSEADVSMEDALKVRALVSGEALEITPEVFKKGLEVELEHGLRFIDANVTNNHPVLTGMIVLAHLKEMLDYYQRLEVAEIEGDILKALQAGDMEKLARKAGLLVSARANLSAWEQEFLAGRS